MVCGRSGLGWNWRDGGSSHTNSATPARLSSASPSNASCQLARSVTMPPNNRPLIPPRLLPLM